MLSCDIACVGIRSAILTKHMQRDTWTDGLIDRQKAQQHRDLQLVCDHCKHDFVILNESPERTWK